ncbi:MAG TPA: ABC transporter permease, partial [Abditibacteriaceae bacterium]
MILLARYLSLRYWLQHRGAFFLSTLGVALGLAVFVSIQIANYSVLSSFSASLDAVAGKANLQIVGGHNGLPDETLAQIRSPEIPGVQASAPLLSKTLYSPSLKTSLLVLGVDLFSESDFRNYNLAQRGESDGATKSSTNAPSAAITFLLDANAMAISRSLAQKYNLKTGNSVVLYSGARRVAFSITQILDGEDLGNAFGGDFALLDIATAQESFASLGRIDQIDLLVDEKQIDDATAQLRKILPPDAIVQRPAQRSSQVAGLLSAFQLNLTALSCISLFVGAFLIYNAIAIAVVRRRSEVGILRALGTARRQIVRLFLAEAAAIGIVGSLLGLLLGLLLARFTLAAVSTTVSALYLAVKAREFVVPSWLWWGAPLVGTGLAVAAALPAAWEAAGTSPRAAIERATLHHTTTRWAWPLAGFGVVLLLIALLLCQPFLSSRTVYVGFAAVFFTLGGFALITPLLTLGGGRLAQTVSHSAIGAKWLGIEGVLAGSYLQRALNRSSLVIATLMVALAMSIGLSVMVQSFRQTVAQWVTTTVSADIYVAPATGFSGDAGDGLPPEVLAYASKLPQLRSLDSIRSVRVFIGNQRVQIAANELPALRTGERQLRFADTRGGEAAAKRAFLENSAVLVSERFRSLVGLGVGDEMEVATPSGIKRFPIAGVFYDYTPNECLVYMPQSLFRKYWRDNATDGLGLYFQPGTNLQAVEDDLQNRFGPRYQLTILQNKGIRDSIFETFDQTFAVTYALQLIAILVAAIGIFDTLIALLLERRREIGILRALGTSERQIHKMTFIEFS